MSKPDPRLTPEGIGHLFVQLDIVAETVVDRRDFGDSSIQLRRTCAATVREAKDVIRDLRGLVTAYELTAPGTGPGAEFLAQRLAEAEAQNTALRRDLDRVQNALKITRENFAAHHAVERVGARVARALARVGLSLEDMQPVYAVMHESRDGSQGIVIKTGESDGHWTTVKDLEEWLSRRSKESQGDRPGPDGRYFLALKVGAEWVEAKDRTSEEWLRLIGFAAEFPEDHDAP